MLTRPKLERGVILALLGLAGVSLIFVFLPYQIDVRILGFVASSDDPFAVETVYNGTPAAVANVREGDLLLFQGSVRSQQWRTWFESDVETYLRKRAEFLDRPVPITVQRDGTQTTLNLSPRSLDLSEFLTFFGIRAFLIVFMLGLIIYILSSRSRDRAAFIISLCFCFTIFWLFCDRPFWPLLFSPLVRSASFPLIYFIEFFEFFFLQLVVATLVHIALVFPQEHALKMRFPLFIPAVYVIALLVPLFDLFFNSGGLLDRINARDTRLWLNSIFLIVLTVLIFTGYRRCRTPVQREKVRWIFVSIAIVAFVHLTIWNIPTMFTGAPLINNYN